MVRRQRLLIIEGDPSLRDFICRTLGESGFEVRSAANGLEGLACFQQQQPDLVLLDLALSGLDGFEVCRRIRRHSIVPMLVLSSLRNDADLITALELGADACLSIPLNVGLLLAHVQALLRRSTWRQHPPSFVSGPSRSTCRASRCCALGRKWRSVAQSGRCWKCWCGTPTASSPTECFTNTCGAT